MSVLHRSRHRFLVCTAYYFLFVWFFSSCNELSDFSVSPEGDSKTGSETDLDQESNPSGQPLNSPLTATQFVGMVAEFAAATPPPGWLVANGECVSKKTYARLYRITGSQFTGAEAMLDRKTDLGAEEVAPCALASEFRLPQLQRKLTQEQDGSVRQKLLSCIKF